MCQGDRRRADGRTIRPKHAEHTFVVKEIRTECTQPMIHNFPVLLFLFWLPSATSLTMTATTVEIPNTMKAVVIRQHGGPEALSYEEDFPVPKDLQDGQVLVHNTYAGLNFIDTYYRKGLYQQPLPFIAGQEGGGVVVQVHPSVSADVAKVGDEVVYSTMGTYCEYTAVAANRVIKLGAGCKEGQSISLEAALCCMVQGLTAHYLTTDCTADLAKPGDWMLIYSVGSGTGQWAAQMATMVNGGGYYKVIGTTSKGKVKTPAAQAACDELIILDEAPGKTYADYSSVDIAQKVMEVTSGNGVKVIIDGVGKSTADISVKCLARRGLWISFGNASGAVDNFSPLQLAPKSGYLTRPKLGDYVVGEELQVRAKEVFGWVSCGKLTVTVDQVFSLKDSKEGHEHLEAGKSRGKVLFKI